MKKSRLPGKITLTILLPVIAAGTAFTILMVSLLTPRIADYFEERNRADLRLAAELAFELCEDNLKELLSLRLENNPGMVETMRRDTLARIQNTALRFPHIELVVIEAGKRIVSAPEKIGEDSGLFIKAAKNTSGTINTTVNNTPYIIYTKYFPFWRWTIVSLITAENAYAPVLLAKRYVYLSMLVFLLFLVVTFIIVFSLLVKKPLLEMTAAAEEVSKGRMKRVETVRSDEIGKVLSAFNAMVDGLEEDRKKLKTSIEEKEVLLKEIHHRVKNNLNIVVSLLNLQHDIVSGPEQAKQALRMSRDRVFSMALVHENLYRSETLSQIDMKSYIDNILRSLLYLYASDKEIFINNNVEAVKMTIEYASPCGLLLNELLTNALTHAFASRKEGVISVGLGKDGTEGKYLLTVEDDGIGLPEDLDIYHTSSMGMQLITVLTEQLGGKLSIKRKNGTKFTVRFGE